MEGSSRSGCSEYSAAAEALFARWLAEGAETDASFDALCEAHPDQAEELAGLRMDWDNVRGLIDQLGLDPRRKPAAPPRPEPAPRPAPKRVAANRPAAASASVPAWLPEPRRRWPLALGLALLALAAVALGLLWRHEARERDALAQESRALAASAAQLATERAEALDGKAAAEREREALRAEAAELERARAASEAARAEAEARAAREARRVALLADTRALEALAAEAETLWPAIGDRAGALEGWLSRARPLVARHAGPAAMEASAALQPLEEASALAERLAGFEGPDGLLARIEARLDLARDPAAAVPGLGAAWAEACAELAEAAPGLAPQPDLAPRGCDPTTGLWRFALLTVDPGGAKFPADSPQDPVIELWLLPAGDAPAKDGAQVPAFFLTSAPPSAEAWRRLGCPDGAERAPCPEALAALGLELASPAELERAARVLGADPPLAGPRLVRRLDG